MRSTSINSTSYTLTTSAVTAEPPASETREKLRRLLRGGSLDDREVELDFENAGSAPTISLFTPQGVEEMGMQFKDLLGGLLPKQTRRRRMKVPAALEALEAAKLVGDPECSVGIFCAIAALLGEEEREEIVAFVTTKGDVSARELIGHCKRVLSGFKVPDLICFMETLPMSVTGKVLKKELTDVYQDERRIERKETVSD